MRNWRLFFSFTFGQGMDPHFDMGEIPTANLSANFVEPDPPADCQLPDNPVTTSHSSTFSPFSSSGDIKTCRWWKPYLSSWHISRLSLSSWVRRRMQAPSSSVLMSELSWRLQRECLWTLATTAESPLEPLTDSAVDSRLSAPETEMLPVAAGGPAPLQAAAPAPDPAAVPAPTPSGLLSEGHTAVILQGKPREAWA